ncbi:MAG TPA: HK97 family phage prohead protease [Mesotoga infera]|nr:HK97 family phage prohead protease [Candidatus Omnitrophota bacterium]HNR79421.1 HK97 family phage prohead protease [Mesotoga infera]
MEIRTIQSEFRVENKEGKAQISGYAAVFNELSDDLGGFREKIQPGAFSEAVVNDDVRALWNHDSNYVLGRNKAGTLKLSEDERGLHYVVDLPDTQWAKDLSESIKRGDVTQSSFGFIVDSDEWAKQDGETVRTLTKVTLFDVSPVTYPAYPQTSTSARSILEANKDRIPDDGAESGPTTTARLDIQKKKLELLEKTL